jgi:hypothetical protein
LTIAQQQQARWWELRAATSLARHWQDEGKYLARLRLRPTRHVDIVAPIAGS